MTTATQLPPPRSVFYDPDGAPLAGGIVHTYVAGGGTTPKTTWQDLAQTIPNSQPIVLDTAGSALIFGNGSYQLAVTDAAGNAVPAYSGLTQGPSAVIVSDAMVPVVTAATLAAAIAVLGIQPAGSYVGTVNTIAALRLNAASTPQAMFVLGYSAVGDLGMGRFVRVPADTTTADNGGTCIVDAAGARWYRDTWSSRTGTTNPAWFGAKNDGTNCAAAVTAALATLAVVGGHLEFGPGTWTINSTITFTYPAGQLSLTISGQGQDVTNLYWPSSNGLVLNGNDARHTFHIEDLTFVTAAAGANTALALNQSSPGGNFGQNDLARVKFVGTSNTTSTGWSKDVAVVGWANINYHGCLFYGVTGVSLLQNVAAGFPYCIVHNFSSCGWFGFTNGISYGSKTQGVTLSQCNFTNGTHAIVVPAGVAECSQLAISGSQFGCTGDQIVLNGPLSELIMNGNLLLNATNAASVVVAATGTANFFTITGNTFEAASNVGTNAIVTLGAAGGTNGSITGNVFQGQAVCVTLQAALSFITVGSNAYTNCTTKVVNAGASNSIGVATL